MYGGYGVPLCNKVQLRQRANLPSPTKATRTETRRGQLEPFFVVVLLNLRGRYYAFSAATTSSDEVLKKLCY